jgi:hypothetical protein
VVSYRVYVILKLGRCVLVILVDIHMHIVLLLYVPAALALHWCSSIDVSSCESIHVLRDTLVLFTSKQDVLDLLKSGSFRGDSETLYDKLVNSSLKQFGADTADAVSYESMLIDAATVLYGRNAKAAVCAWQAVHESAAYKFRKLQNYFLLKVVNDQLWVHDVIKSIATRKAHIKNTQSVARVWLPDQVHLVLRMCCNAMHMTMLPCLAVGCLLMTPRLFTVCLPYAQYVAFVRIIITIHVHSGS